MAYYFMVEEKKGNYRELDLTNVAGFVGSRKYKKYGAYGLDEIDAFTMMFQNELELRRALVTERVLTTDNIAKPLSIRWVAGTKKNKVPYDFLYQKDFEYVYEPYKLLQLVMRRYYQNEFEFIRKLAIHFRNHYVCSDLASEVSMYAGDASRYGLGNRYLEMTDKNGDNLVKRLVKMLLYKHFVESTGYVCYTDEVDYRNLHEMITFINNYDRQHGLSEPKKKVRPEDLFVSNNSQANKDKPKVKKLVKRKSQIDGQMSMFDFFDN